MKIKEIIIEDMLDNRYPQILMSYKETFKKSAPKNNGKGKEMKLDIPE
jgi:hypothetical protein